MAGTERRLKYDTGVKGYIRQTREGGNQIMNSEQRVFEILALDNMELAVKQVKANKGSVGVDGMKVYELDKFVNSKEFRKILHLIEIGEYRPSQLK